MERSEDTTFDTPAPSEPECDCLLEDLVQLVDGGTRSEHDRQAAKALLAKRRPFYNQRWTVVRALTALERVDSQAGGSRGFELSSTRIYTAPSTPVTSVPSRRSTARFARSFKHTFGESPHAYVMRNGNKFVT